MQIIESIKIYSQIINKNIFFKCTATFFNLISTRFISNTSVSIYVPYIASTQYIPISNTQFRLFSIG